MRVKTILTIIILCNLLVLFCGCSTEETKKSYETTVTSFKYGMTVEGPGPSTEEITQTLNAKVGDVIFEDSECNIKATITKIKGNDIKLKFNKKVYYRDTGKEEKEFLIDFNNEANFIADSDDSGPDNGVRVNFTVLINKN